jgi:CRISPR-associated endonuclease/helicase Cas3
VAPLDALVQRMGRVNRRRRSEIADVRVFGGGRGDPAPYRRADLEAAWSVLAAHDGEAVDEGRLQAWLDQAMELAGGEAWEAAVRSSRDEFRRAFVDAMPVFSSDEDLAKLFDDLFDGAEVLPESLVPEYREILAGGGGPLAAAELLVPLPARQLGMLRRKGLVRWEAELFARVASCPYEADLGLRIA